MTSPSSVQTIHDLLQKFLITNPDKESIVHISSGSVSFTMQLLAQSKLYSKDRGECDCGNFLNKSISLTRINGNNNLTTILTPQEIHAIINHTNSSTAIAVADSLAFMLNQRA